MRKPLKYQDLIDAEKLTIPCPDEDIHEGRKDVFRWCNEPIGHECNFLPNRFADQQQRKPKRKLKGDKDCCEYCALSFFDSLEQSKDRFMGFPGRIREILGYTHIATGGIDEDDGVMSPSDEFGHFNFFEYYGISVQLENKFLIIHKF